MSYGNQGWNESRKVNWDDVPDDGPQPLEHGIYVGKVIKAGPQGTKKDKKPAAKIQIRILATWDDDQEVPGKRVVFGNLGFTEDGAASWTKQIANAADIELPEENGLDYVRRFCRDLLNQEIILELGENEYQGRKNNKVIRYLTQDQAEEAVSSAADGPPDDDEGADDKDAAKASRNNEREAEPEPEPEPKRSRRRGVDRIADEAKASNGASNGAAKPEAEATTRRRRRARA